MRFESRTEAGQRLGAYLLERGVTADLVLGLPRGGVLVAAEVARALRCPLDLLVVRKIGHPWNREFAVGAIAEGDVVVLDRVLIGPDRPLQMAVQAILAEEQHRLREYQALFRRSRPMPRADRAILLVDDGLATGASMEVAVQAVRRQSARSVTVAVPVASPEAVERLRAVADHVVSLWTDPGFDAVGRYYRHFEQTNDAEVLQRLRENEEHSSS